MAKQKNIGHIVTHTHWDREWRYPIWKNRMLLVEMMDVLLELLETNPEYRNFVLDGQAVPIADYLQVRPDKREVIAGHVQDERLSIGPWFSLPDLYPVDGECLVRNLLKGKQYCEQFGKRLNVAHTSFGWGQTAQFPQIYKGFGLDFVVAGKNVSKERAPECEFLWESPDGTQVLATRLGAFARANFFMNAYIEIAYGFPYMSDRYRFSWGKNFPVYHEANSEASYKDYFRIGHEEDYFKEMIKAGVERAWQAYEETLLKDYRLILNGSDFSTPQTILPRIIKDANSMLDDVELVHGTFDEYRKILQQRLDVSRLRVVKGELRDGPPHACSANALATRIGIKQLNKKVQNTLIRKAEPLATLLSLLGCEYPGRFFEIAWEHLLLAHAHDSINGVTQDKTARDTVYKLEQALEIAEVTYEKAMSDAITKIDLSGFARDDIIILVFNPLPSSTREVLKIDVDTPQEKAIWDFDLVDAHGNKREVQHCARQEKLIPVHELNCRPWPFHLDRHTVIFDPGEIPACGWKAFKLLPRHHFSRTALFWPEAPVSTGVFLSPGATSLENEHLRATIRPNGTLDLLEKATGKAFSGLHYFEDGGDVGDYWIRYAPYHDEIVTSHCSQAQIRREENGPLSATLAVELKMEVPARGHRPEAGIRGKSARSKQTTTLRTTSRFTLRRNAKRLDVRTEIDNTAQDHRLRLCFPTGIATDRACASGHFTVDEREKAQPTTADNPYFVEMQTKPMQHFVDVSDAKTGFAVVNNCLTEYELLNDERTTIALTLVRCVRNIICSEFRSAGVFEDQDGGQSPGKLSYEYALYPHSGSWDEGAVFEQAEALNVRPVACQTSGHAKGNVPPETSLFALEPSKLILSALKRAENGKSALLRVYNPTDSEINGTLRWPVEISRAWLVRLDETREQELKSHTAKTLNLTLGAKKIVTVEIETSS
ncbi:MAG: alpha-mannosidase [Chitinivibrionales bacterium]|nr:alpha-mannosidase [Chitinivibrionales bacterium]